MTNSKQDLVQYANQLISKSMDIMKANNEKHTHCLQGLDFYSHPGNFKKDYKGIGKMHNIINKKCGPGIPDDNYADISFNKKNEDEVISRYTGDKPGSELHNEYKDYVKPISKSLDIMKAGKSDKKLFRDASNADISVLKSPKVDKIKDQFKSTPLHELARRGESEVLKHPSVDKIEDYQGFTPLHRLAISGNKYILDHPSVDKVKNQFGETPLHLLARYGHPDIFNNPSVDKVKDMWGKTPKDRYDDTRKREY